MMFSQIFAYNGCMYGLDSAGEIWFCKIDSYGAQSTAWEVFRKK